MDKISVIIPFYNSQTTIEKTINSIKKQNYSNLEILLINDGSIDNSLRICENISKDDARIKIFNQKNSGVSSARNLGLDKATGKYITFLDSDDCVGENFIYDLYQGILKKDVDLSCCGIVRVNKRRNFNGKEYIFNDENKYVNLFSVYGGFLWNKLYENKIIKEKNIRLKPNINMCEDLVFNFEYLKYCENVYYIDKGNYKYLENGNSLSKGLTDKWFTIIDAYKEIFKDYESYDKDTQLYLQFNYVLVLLEARIRAIVMKKSKRTYVQYKIEAKKILIRFWKNIIENTKIKLREKIRLLFFYNFPILVGKIKFKGVKKSV